MKQAPISAWSSLAYPLASVAVVGHDPGWHTAIFAAAMLALGIASFAFHDRWTPTTARFDHATMNAATAALACLVLGLSPVAILVAALASAVVLEVVMDVGNRPIVGIYIGLAIMGGLEVAPWDVVATSVALMGLGFWVWHFRTDWAHGAWHLLTATGMSLLAIAAL